jgi:hypothetical protein
MPNINIIGLETQERLRVAYRRRYRPSKATTLEVTSEHHNHYRVTDTSTGKSAVYTFTPDAEIKDLTLNSRRESWAGNQK